MGTGGSFPVGKLTGESNCLPTSTYCRREEWWSCTYTFPRVFMAWKLIYWAQWEICLYSYHVLKRCTKWEVIGENIINAFGWREPRSLVSQDRASHVNCTKARQNHDHVAGLRRNATFGRTSNFAATGPKLGDQVALLRPKVIRTCMNNATQNERTNKWNTWPSNRVLGLV